MALKMNREKCPLFLACKDSENQMLTYLCAFMPSECLWVFDWLYTRAMPQLLGEQVLQQMNISLIDGDKKIRPTGGTNTEWDIWNVPAHPMWVSFSRPFYGLKPFW
jgi:hypothetical protein